MFARFHVTKQADDVVLAQAEAFTQRVPILYVILIVNTATLAYTHYSDASKVLTVYAPLAFILAMVVRLYHWYALRKSSLTVEQARAAVRVTTPIVLALSLLLLAWSLTLLNLDVEGRHGLMSGDGHVVLYVALTVICCIFLLMHVRVAALSVAVAIVPVFCAYLMSTGDKIEIAVAINLLLVCAAMTYVLFVFAHDFERSTRAKSRLRQLSERNRQLANSDAVTGLPNRRHLFAALDHCRQSAEAYGIILIDLDGFKQINDLYGHAVGDKVLVEASERLTKLLPHGATLARMGGDEFAILLPGQAHLDDIVALSNELIAAMRLPIILPETIAHLGATAGVSMADPFGDPECDHYNQADYALVHAKRRKRGLTEVFSPFHAQSIRMDGEIEQAMRQAGLDEEISIVFQPIVNASNAAVIGYEALARWHHARLGPVPPSAFVAVAERSDLIHRLTLNVLEKALAAAREWPDHITVKVNLSIRDLSSPEQVLRLISLVRRSAVDPKRVAFEITESVLCDDLNAVGSALNVLRAMGASVAVDDFGNGYSNLRYIHRLQPEIIKIDRSFVERLGEDPHVARMVKTIIEMCENVGARSLAEGAETATQVDALRSLGCDQIQGYYFGRPMSAAEVAADLRARAALAHAPT